MALPRENLQAYPVLCPCRLLPTITLLIAPFPVQARQPAPAPTPEPGPLSTHEARISTWPGLGRTGPLAKEQGEPEPALFIPFSTSRLGLQ